MREQRQARSATRCFPSPRIACEGAQVYFMSSTGNENGRRRIEINASGLANISVLIMDGVQQMGLTHVTVALKALGTPAGTYEADFLVDTGATDCLAPTGKLKQIEVEPVGTMVYELADGTKHAYPFGLVEIRFMGEITAGRVIFGPDDVEPVLGVTALESVGITIDPANRTLKRLPAIPLKSMGASLLSAIWERR
jgi:clan AA aspartic protease